MASQLEILENLIKPVTDGLGYQLWGIEYISQGKHSVLRVYIDGENGVGMDDCVAVSQQVSAVMDVEDPISGEYALEVSSPGMDRPIFTAEQYALHKGNTVELRLRSPFEGRRKFKGVIVGLEEGDLVLLVDNQEFLLPVDGIEKANIVPQF